MPNWCMNNVRLKHKDPAMITKVAESTENLFSKMLGFDLDEVDRDFLINTIGTKWDVDADIVCQEDNEIDLCFDSAWSPPIEGYGELEDLGFTIEAQYYEPGMAFVGEFTTELGDHCIEIEEMTNEWLTDNIPEDWLEHWCILDDLEEFDDE